MAIQKITSRFTYEDSAQFIAQAQTLKFILGAKINSLLEVTCKATYIDTQPVHTITWWRTAV